jgi:hypothetical protein
MTLGDDDPGAATQPGRKPQMRIFHNPQLDPPPSPASLPPEQFEAILATFSADHLIDDDHSPEDVKQALDAMVRVGFTGGAGTRLFEQDGGRGMSVFHIWWGPDVQLWRHSHPGMGDCLYLIIAGEARMGNHVLRPGDGFWVTDDMPYRYTAGPNGVELLEIRPGGGSGQLVNLVQEPSIAAIEAITERARSLQPKWANPPRHFGEVARLEAEQAESV